MQLYESDPYNVSFEEAIGLSLDALKEEWLACVDALPWEKSVQEIGTSLNL